MKSCPCCMHLRNHVDLETINSVGKKHSKQFIFVFLVLCCFRLKQIPAWRKHLTTRIYGKMLNPRYWYRPLIVSPWSSAMPPFEGIDDNIDTSTNNLVEKHPKKFPHRNRNGAIRELLCWKQCRTGRHNLNHFTGFTPVCYMTGTYSRGCRLPLFNNGWTYY